MGRVLVRRRRAARGRARGSAGTATVTWYDVDGGGPPRTASWATPDPTAALAEVLGEMRPVDVPGLPRFWGGAVGWIAYDCVRAFEDLPARAPAPTLDLPPLCDGHHRHAAHLRQPAPDAEGRRDAVRRRAPSAPRPPTIARARGSTRSSTTLRAPRTPLPDARAAALGERAGDRAAAVVVHASAEFVAAVDRVKEYILAGDAFQVVLSQRFAEPAAARARSTSTARCA